MVLTSCCGVNPLFFASQVSPGKSWEFPQRSCQLQVLFQIQTLGAAPSLLVVRPVTRDSLAWLLRWLCSGTFRSTPTDQRCGPIFCHRTCFCSQLTSSQLLHSMAWLSQFVHTAWVLIFVIFTMTVPMHLWGWGRCCGCDRFAIFSFLMRPFVHRLRHPQEVYFKTHVAVRIWLSLDTILEPCEWLWLKLSQSESTHCCLALIPSLSKDLSSLLVSYTFNWDSSELHFGHPPKLCPNQ